MTIGEVLEERVRAGRLLRLYRPASVALVWVGEDEDRSLWTWPAEGGGWADRRQFAGDRASLVEAQPHNAAGSGWPGLSAPQ